MTIQELIKKNKKDANLKKILEVRTYIPIAEKRAIIEVLLEGCYTVEDDFLTCDYITMRTMFELAMIKYHTNLEIDITSEDDYDELQKLGIDFHNEYLTDYKECELLFEGERHNLCSQYSVEASVARLSNKISKGVENLTDSLTKKINSFDMGTLGFNNTDIENLKTLLGKYGKQV
jgi:hypothetical protein